MGPPIRWPPHFPCAFLSTSQNCDLLLSRSHFIADAATYTLFGKSSVLTDQHVVEIRGLSHLRITHQRPNIDHGLAALPFSTDFILAANPGCRLGWICKSPFRAKPLFGTFHHNSFFSLKNHFAGNRIAWQIEMSSALPKSLSSFEIEIAQ
jgi:hypothetical protein